jgi:hypothetical protein
MMNVHALLLVFAFVFFVVSAFPPVNPYWNRCISIGLACATAAFIF